MKYLINAWRHKEDEKGNLKIKETFDVTVVPIRLQVTGRFFARMQVGEEEPFMIHFNDLVKIVEAEKQQPPQVDC